MYRHVNEMKQFEYIDLDSNAYRIARYEEHIEDSLDTLQKAYNDGTLSEVRYLNLLKKIDSLIENTVIAKSTTDAKNESVAQCKLTKECSNKEANNSELLTEGSGADTAKLTTELLDALADSQSSQQWMKTTSDIIKLVPDNLIDDVFDLCAKEFHNVRLPANKKDELLSALETENDEPIDTSNVNTFGDFIKTIDGVEFARKHPDACKGLLLAALGIISVIEPTPVGEVITGIVSMLPSNIIGKVFELLQSLTPVHILNKIVNKDKNECYESLSKERLEKELSQNQ